MIDKSQIKRDKILQTTMELIAENGFHDSPTALIAKTAGVSKGTLFWYFENKDNLIFELYHDCDAKLHAYIREGYCPELPIRDRFVHLASRLLQYGTTNPVSFKFMEQFHNSPYGRSVRQERYYDHPSDDVFIELFHQGIKHKVIKDLPIVILFAQAYAPISFIVRDQLAGFIELDDQLMKSWVSASWDSVKL